MALPLGSSIETQITDGPTLVSQMNNNVQAIQSVVQDVPQIQTVLTDNVVNVSSIINAPFIEVTSVNGMTGDVVVEPIIEDFQANHYYLKNTMINYNGQIYWAKNTFTSGSSFNASDWNAVSISISTAWNDITGKPNFATVATSGSYNDLSNKPTFATVATSGSYNDLSNKPTIPTVNNATLTIQKNGTTVKTFTANASSNVTANITVPTAVTDLSDASNYVTQTDIADVIRTTDVGVIRGQNIADSEITSSKIDWSTLDGSELGWKYLGQVKLTSAAASLTFNLPAQYNNYKIIAAGEMATGSNATCQLQLLRSEAAIPSAWCVLDVNGSSIVAGTRTADDNQFSMMTCNQYDTINMEMTSFKTSTSQWRKYQGYQTRMGSAFVMRQYNGRFNSSTEPNQVRIWTSATFGVGAVIKVWASNN